MLNGPSMRKKMEEKAKFVEEYEREQARPLREAEAQYERTANNLAIAERDLAAAELMRTPSAYLTEHCTPYKNNLSPDDVSSAITDAVAAFKLGLHERGIKLTDRGFQKLACVVQKNLPTVDSTSTKNLMTVFDYMGSLGVFDYEDCTRPAPAPKVTPTPAPAQTEPLPDLETMDTSTRAGQKQANLLLMEHIVEEQRPLFLAFVNFMRQIYEHPMSQKTQEDLVEFCVRHGAFDAKNFNAWRRSIGCLSPDEKLGRDLESANTPASDYQTRREFIRRQKEL